MDSRDSGLSELLALPEQVGAAPMRLLLRIGPRRSGEKHFVVVQMTNLIGHRVDETVDIVG